MLTEPSTDKTVSEAAGDLETAVQVKSKGWARSLLCPRIIREEKRSVENGGTLQ